MSDVRQLGDRYQVGELLGRGGMAEVHEGRDLRLGRRVALKLLQGRLITETRRRRFQREAEILARIDHHAIAEVLDADFDGEEPFIAMRFVPGTDLAAEVRAARLTREAEAAGAAADRAAGEAAVLAARIQQAEAEIEVVIMSDGLTDVAIYHVGRLGLFQEKQLVLRTGNYTATGSRNGFRDVRQTLKVRPGSGKMVFTLRCEEPI